MWESNLSFVRIQRSYEESQRLWNYTWECEGALIAHGLPTRLSCRFRFWQHHLHDFAVCAAQGFWNCLRVNIQSCANVRMA